MATDKKTIGITKANAATLGELVTAGHFGSELDAAKFAMSYTIRGGTSAGATDGADTKWNVGSVDSDGSLRALVEALYPDVPDPYRLIEHLMNEGIQALRPAHSGAPIDVHAVLFPR